VLLVDTADTEWSGSVGNRTITTDLGVHHLRAVLYPEHMERAGRIADHRRAIDVT